MPWHLPADLAHFKCLTMGAPIVMGRVTYESIGRPLPGRQNIVVSRNRGLELPGTRVVHDFREALMTHGDGPVFVIGGGQIYRQAMPLAQRLVITHVETTIDNADTFFDLPDKDHWESLQRTRRAADDRNRFDLTFEVYQRRLVAG